MNREIKFRGKRIDNGDWVYGDLRSHTDNGKVYIFPHAADHGATGQEVAPETVGQYTGLQDRHNKEIYEDDILHSREKRSTFEGVVDHYEPIIFEGGVFAIDNVYSRSTPMSDLLTASIRDWVNFDIAGNIHDNPELMKP